MEGLEDSSNVRNFMESPLVTWIKTFFDEDEELEYKQLVDGVFLYDVMLQIDPRPPHRGICRSVDDVTTRTRNLDILIKNVRAFYEEKLGQLVLLKLPDVVTIGSEPETDPSVEDIQLLVLLILGSAVQCDKKEEFVDSIKQLDIDVQHAIVESIQQVTDNPETVWTDDWTDLANLSSEQLSNIYRCLVHHLKRLIYERNALSQRLTELVLYQDNPNVFCDTSNTNAEIVFTDDNIRHDAASSNSRTSDKHHLGVELADSKAKLRRLRQELEEKTEAISEFKDELEQVKGTVTKLRQENLDLVQEARAAKAYRDEIDVLKERANKVDKLENEIQRYKDKMNELDFYKSRVDELREDNRILVETKEMLEDQLESSRKRAEQVLHLENDILRHKSRMNELILEKEADKERLQELVEDNTQLELDKKSCMNESAVLRAELKNIKSQNNSMLETSLSEQMNENAHGRVLRLELEIQRLQSIVDSFRESSFHENSEKILELEKENKRLSMKVDQLQDCYQKEAEKFIDVEQEHGKCARETTRLQDVIETLRTSSERQQKELRREKQQLSDVIETLRERNKKSEHARHKDVESENKKLSEQSQNLKRQLSKFEFENQQLKKNVDRLKCQRDNLIDVQFQKEEIEKENYDLHQTISAFKSTRDNYEKLEADFCVLNTEHAKVAKSYESAKSKCAKMEKMERENINLRVENQKINKALDCLKSSAKEVLEIEHEKEELVHKNELLAKNIEILKSSCAKLEDVEVEMMSTSNDCQRLQKSLESSNKKIEDVSQDNQDLETENRKLQKTVETLKVSMRRYNDLERETTEFEADNDKLNRENKSLEKEAIRLKQAIEVKDSTVDELSSKISSLDRENKRMQKELDSDFQSAQRVCDLEMENKELTQHSTVDKKTLVILREDLVNEKIRTQQLQNELEKLTSDLQKFGINKEKLVDAGQLQDQNRYKMLESLLEDTLKNSLEIKDEKISTLESKLKEAKDRNIELKEHLKRVETQCENYRIKYDEMKSKRHRPAEEERSLSNLKDELHNTKNQIEDLEKMNSCLKEENRSLQSHTSSWKEQASGLQNQLMNLQKHCSALTNQNTELQSKQAKLQVENTTLLSVNQSIGSQISNMQTQSSNLETDSKRLKNVNSKLQAAHDSLIADHEAFQKLHEQLTSDYESLVSDFTALKSVNKTVRSEHRAMKEKLQSVLLTQEDVIKIKESLEEEKSNFRADCKSLVNLRTEHHSLKDDFRSLHGNYEKLRTEYKGLQVEYKTLKNENNNLKLKNTELQGDVDDSKASTNSLDIQVTKLSSKCELLMQMNNTLEDDRKSLMNQLSSLLTQYHDLLTQTLNDKENYHEEEKMFADKVNNLRRQKEMLEQKIMDQYRRMENSPKRKGFSLNLVKRVRKAGSELISRVPRTGRSRERSRNGDHTDSADNSSSATDGTGSDVGIARISPDSVDHEVNGAVKDNLQRFIDLSALDSVMNAHKSLPPTSGVFEQHEKSFRGSYSSEDVRSLLTDSHSSDGHHADEESPTPSVRSNNAADKSNGDGDKDGVGDTLSLPGSRKAVYYTSIDGLNHDDTIPTRDVGPGISNVDNVNGDPTTTSPIMSSSSSTKTCRASTNVASLTPDSSLRRHYGSTSKGRSTPEGARSSPRSDTGDKLLNNGLPPHQYSSMINVSKVSSPILLPRKTSTPAMSNSVSAQHRKSLRNILVDQNDSNSSSDANSTIRSASTRKSWRNIDTDNLLRSGGNSPSTPSSVRHDSRLLQNGAIVGDSTNSTNDKNVRSAVETVADSGNEFGTSSPQIKKGATTDGNARVDNSSDEHKEKRTDNSIWYEYGCV